MVVILSKIVAFQTETNDEVCWKLVRLNSGDGLDSNQSFFNSNCRDSQRNTGGINEMGRDTE